MQRQDFGNNLSSDKRTNKCSVGKQRFVTQPLKKLSKTSGCGKMHDRILKYLFMLCSSRYVKVCAYMYIYMHIFICTETEKGRNKCVKIVIDFFL